MARHRLTDKEWDLICDIFPLPPRMGRPTVDRRNVLDGVLWILQTGAPWRDMPEEFGKWQTAWRLFNTWNKDGTLDEIERRLRTARIAAGEIDAELWCIDGTTIRAARCAAGARKKAA